VLECGTEWVGSAKSGMHGVDSNVFIENVKIFSHNDLRLFL